MDKHDLKIASMIADRAVGMAATVGQKWRKDHALMDIMVCHKKCPLKLDQLLEADDFNFSHDVFGINRNLNHETGELENCFLPRFAA